MNITTFKKVLPYLVEAKISPWVWGLHAKGKTETIEAAYRDNDWLVFNFRLNCMADTGDLLGLQDFEVDENGNKIATKFCMPDWLKQAIDFCTVYPKKRACIFIDEVNRAARLDLIGPIFQMALDHKLHTFDFSKLNIDIILASNPATNDYSLLDLTDKALMSRFCHVHFNPTAKEFLNYAKLKKINPAILEFLNEQPDFLEEQSLEVFSINNYARPDRRKWFCVSKLMDAPLSKEEFSETISGLVGIEAAIAFEKWQTKEQDPITLEDVMNNYPAIRKKVQKLAKVEHKTASLSHTCSKLIEFFATNAAFTGEQGVNMIHFLEDVPKDLMYNVFYTSFNQKTFFEFCENNEALLKNIERSIEEVRKTIDNNKSK